MKFSNAIEVWDAIGKFVIKVNFPRKGSTIVRVQTWSVGDAYKYLIRIYHSEEVVI